MDIDEEYKQLVKSIQNFTFSLSRHHQIRSKLWLDKLAQPITNIVWKQNRNLYLKTLREMAQEGELQKPFHQTPPEGPLNKLNLYDLPYPIRLKLMEEENRTDRTSSNFKRTPSISRRNSITNSKPLRSLSKNGNKMQHKKKIQFETENQQNYLSSKNDTMKTETLFTSIDNYKSKMQNTQKIHYKSENILQKKITDFLKKTLKYLEKHSEDLEDQVKYVDVIDKILTCGKQLGIKWKEEKNKKNKMEEEFQVRNQRIKQNFLRGDLNSLQFLNYLDSLH